MLPTKEEFVNYIKFIKDKQEQQNNFCDVVELLDGNSSRCDCLIYQEYENVLYKLLGSVFDDKYDLIGYKLYEFDALSDEDKKSQLLETPEVETWETLYDYLIKNLNKESN